MSKQFRSLTWTQLEALVMYYPSNDAFRSKCVPFFKSGSPGMAKIKLAVKIRLNNPLSDFHTNDNSTIVLNDQGIRSSDGQNSF